MKKYLYLLVSLFALFTLKSNAQCNAWQTLGIDDTIQPSFGSASFTAIATKSGQPYLIYSDGTDGNKATVVTQTGPGAKWTLVGSQGFSAGATQYNSIAISQTSGNIYAAYQDAGSSGKAVVMMSNGGPWSALGLPVSVSGAQYISLAIKPGAKDTVLIAFEDGNKANHISVYKYNYASWIPVGITGFSAGVASYIALQFANGTPYVAYSDASLGNKAVAQSFTGVTWAAVKTSSGFSAGAASYISMGIDASSDIYVSYQDGSRADSGSVMEYTGGSWKAIGLPNKVPCPGVVSYTSLYVNGSNLFVAFYDTTRGTASVMNYNGTAWSYFGSPSVSDGKVAYVDITPGTSGMLLAYQDIRDGSKAGVQLFNSSWTYLSTHGVSSAYANTPSVALNSTGVPYMAYVDDSANNNRIAVQGYSGSWNYTYATRFVSPSRAHSPFMAVAPGGAPFVGYIDDSIGHEPFVKWYSSGWIPLGGTPVATTISTNMAIDMDAFGYPYVIFDSTVVGYPEVKYYTGSKWSKVGTSITGSGIKFPYICVNRSTNVPYIIFSNGAASGKAYVLSFATGAWSVLGGGPISTGEANYTSIALDASGNVYAAFQDVANNYGVSVEKYTSGWNYLGTAGFAPHASGVKIAIDSLGVPYISYIDSSAGNRVTVQKWSGTAWQVLGTTGISAGAAVQSTSMAIHGTSPIVVYQDRGTVAKKFTTFTLTVPANTITCEGKPVTLTASSGAASYTWQPSTGLSCTNCMAPMATPTSTTTYAAIATYPGGCKDTAQTTVTVSNGQNIYTVAGNGSAAYSGDGGPAIKATMNLPTGVALDAAGNMYIADQQNNVVRKVNSATGIITTFAGNGTAGFGGDSGPATAAEFNLPSGLAFDNSGNLYIADQKNGAIRKVNTSGIITTVAGTGGTNNYGGDSGPATAAYLNYPTGIAFDNAGNMYIADANNNRVRKVTTSGIISTFAGTGVGGLTTGVLATAGDLYKPTSVAVDASNNVYIADQNNNRVQEVTFLSLIINTVAGSSVGTLGYTGDGSAATSATLNTPIGVTLDPAGNLYIADEGNNVIREVSTSGTINTVAGNGAQGYSGDNGPATSAELYLPWAVAFDAMGYMYVPDNYNNRVRVISPCGPSPTVSISTSPSSTICAGASTTITANASPGPIAYAWSPATGLSSTTAAVVTASPTVTTTYTVSATNSSGTGTDTVTIHVNPLPPDSVLPAHSAMCALTGDTIKALPTSNFYTWSCASGGFTDIGTDSSTVIFSTSSTGVKTIYVTIENKFGCKVKDSVKITVNSLPVVSVTPPSVLICQGSTTTLTAKGASTYSWSPSIGLSPTTGSIVTAFPSTTTVYTVTGTSSSTGCSNTAAAKVKVDNLTAPMSFANPTCFNSCNGRVTVSPTGGIGSYTYTWNTGSSKLGTDSSLCGNYTYKVTIKDSACYITDSVTLVNPTLISNSMSSNNVPCFGGTGGVASDFVGGGTPPFTYSWSTGATTSGISGVGAGTYTIIVTDNHGCTAKDSVTITQPPKISATITSTTPACYNMADGSATIGVSGGTPPYYYSWAPSGGTNATATTLASGTTYTVIITDSSGCTASKTLSIFEETQIRDSAISTTLISCFGGNNGAITMGVKGGSAPYAYSWNNSSSSTISTTTSASGLSTGTYTFIVKDNNGCSDTSTVFFAQPTQLTATSVVMTICPGTSATLNANALGGTSPYTYSWNPTSATSPTINVTPTSNTSYVVTVTDSNNCKASGTDSVKFYPPIITVISSPPSVCSGSNVTIFTSSSGGNGGFTYAWYQGSGIISTGNSVIVAPTTTTSYILITKDACGDTTAKTVTITPKPVPSVTVCCDSTIVVGQSVQLIASSSLTNIFAWMPAAGLSCVNCNTPKATPDITTTYTVTVTDTADGCFVVDTVTITIGTNNIVFYSGITPNGDGKNDTWVIDNINLYPNNTVSIFNRWGTEVWTANNYNNTTVVWDGHDSKGQLLPDATYYYVAKIGNNTYKGWVQLTR